MLSNYSSIVQAHPLDGACSFSSILLCSLVGGIRMLLRFVYGVFDVGVLIGYNVVRHLQEFYLFDSSCLLGLEGFSATAAHPVR